MSENFQASFYVYEKFRNAVCYWLSVKDIVVIFSTCVFSEK